MGPAAADSAGARKRGLQRPLHAPTCGGGVGGFSATRTLRGAQCSSADVTQEVEAFCTRFDFAGHYAEMTRGAGTPRGEV